MRVVQSGELSLKKKGLYGLPSTFAAVAPEIKQLDLTSNEMSGMHIFTIVIAIAKYYC